MKSKRTI